MPNFTDITGLISVASALAALLLPLIKRSARHHRAILAATIFVIVLFPFGGLPLAAYVRGATGDLSITTMALIWCALLNPWIGSEISGTYNRFTWLALIVLGAIVLYPMSLGYGSFDPYRFGYADWRFLALLLLIALAAWYRKHDLLALSLALATLAWVIGWYESSNLWDYLLDPFVSVYALAALLMRATKTLTKPLLNKTGKPTMLN